ncbi:hypothetical protein BACCIP111899_03362 [Bacillus rhizoplanae]|uniref:Uncharacterized protein n=1 Tax=Bacillus rhizoplanae TaxID=2880966 RepID=A0ABM8YEN6_9BACI|nr:hypothetical protein [Bacillus rhizoplanae]CAG9614135.1 hypothetical protein BACCIP111899_03362 [Bacillus rhizoplanae]
MYSPVQEVNFKNPPEVTTNLFPNLKNDPGEYARKSIGNAILDISKKHQELIRKELNNWNSKEPFVLFTYQIASRH